MVVVWREEEACDGFHVVEEVCGDELGRKIMRLRMSWCIGSRTLLAMEVVVEKEVENYKGGLKFFEKLEGLLWVSFPPFWDHLFLFFWLCILVLDCVCDWYSRFEDFCCMLLSWRWMVEDEEGGRWREEKKHIFLAVFSYYYFSFINGVMFAL